ncbi:hypothetical protein HEP81_01989 [Streptomyces griseofuscus]|uniref:Uncharacterized protein n=1 Tax=Streptomyces griseofuscus TaxID=146922 RepID=A0A7H1PW86_9ACTN|nr:hypothetical protein [Streptomyces griseofuscus]QNT92316.1 hypothetical protein HEP81_01989 [Streptomyces griseofuscus]
MPQRTPSTRRSMYDLAALVTVLATGVALVALGVAPDSLAAVTIALAGLYSAWRTGLSGRGTEREPELTTRDDQDREAEAVRQEGGQS